MSDPQSADDLAQRLVTELMFVQNGDLKTIGKMLSWVKGVEDPAMQTRLVPVAEILGRMTIAEEAEYQSLFATLAQRLEDFQAEGVKRETPAPVSDPAPIPPREEIPQNESFSSGRELTEEETRMQDIDRDLFLEFVEESISHLQSIELDILSLESDPANKTIIDNIFRPFHTIKGVAGFLALKEVHQVCHDLENMMDDARRGHIDVIGPVSDVVLDAVDLLKKMIASVQGVDNPVRQLAAFQPEVEVFITRVRTTRQNALAKGGRQSAASAMAQPVVQPAPQPLPVQSIPSTSAPVQSAPAMDEIRPAAPPVELPVSGNPEESSAPQFTGEMAQAPSTESIRVRINLLNQLMDLAGELVLGRNQLLQKISTIKEEIPGLVSVVQQVDRVTSELQESVMQTRMQPIGGLFSRYHRVIRDLARNLGKQIELHSTGEGVELDKSLIEAMTDPLTHLIRNAADHGIESPEVRAKAGKPPVGKVTLEAYQEGGKVRVKVADDGAGINLDRVKSKALEKGLITKEEAVHLTERETIDLLFQPGFSTADKVTGMSGRGVGMDVVRMNVEKIGGIIEVVNHPGVGTTFFLDLPLTLAIVPALIVMTGGERFAIPQINLLELVHLEGQETADSIMRVRGSEVFRLRGEMQPLLRLGRVLDIQHKSLSGENTSVYIVVLAAGKTQFGLVVDAIYDTEEIVVKPVGNLLKHLPVFAGATLMGDGRPALILDVAGLARSANMVLGEEHGVGTLKDKDVSTKGKDDQSILLFTISDKEQFAVPLPLISRLEEVDAGKIQHAINGKVIEYRGDLLPLVFMEDTVPIEPPPQGREKVTVLVFELERNVGLVVTKIVDSLEMTVRLDSKSMSQKGFSGMALVQGKPTAFVDIYQLIEMIYPDWFRREKQDRQRIRDPKDKIILLAEDSNFYRTMEKNYLTQEGFKVIEVEDGQKALNYLKKHPVDILVTDIEMPHLNGFELSQKIRADKELAHLPIIALTSLAHEEDREKGRNAGVNAYLIKLHKEELLQELHRLLHQ
ncbi:MAG: chemotaxis protein CheW [Deltaproteobacteria bacterium]|nr:chemotaxis protein CheW [Deltaproteobacteria bacterium]